MGRICIFCEEAIGHGHGEHLFPEWIGKLFKPGSELGQQYPTGASSAIRSHWNRARRTFEDYESEVSTWSTSQIASETTKWICNYCNTHWMSVLEGNARPLLTPLIHGKLLRLDHNQQLLVAGWTAKSVMVLEMTTGKESPRFTQPERTTVMQEQCPPLSLHVSFGMLPLGTVRFGYSKTTGFGNPLYPGDPKLSWRIDVIVIGHLGLIARLQSPDVCSNLRWGMGTPMTRTELPLFPPTDQGTVTLPNTQLDLSRVSVLPPFLQQSTTTSVSVWPRDPKLSID